jgi:HEAT repeat protein
MSASMLALLVVGSPFQEDPERLVERLKAEDAAERRKASEELRRRGAAAVPASIRALERAAPDPAPRVAELVRRLSSKAWKERDESMRELARIGRPGRAALEPHASSGDPEVAWRVKTALAEIQEHSGREDLLEALRDAALCELLGELGDRRAVGPLLKALWDPRPEIGRRAAEALGKLRGGMEAGQSDQAAERILAMLEQSASARDKSLLVRALGGLRAPGAVAPLAALLSDRSEKNIHLKRACVAALAASGDARGVRAILDALGADDVYLRQGAQAALEELSGGPTGFDPRRSPGENRAALEKLRAWWSRKFGRPWEE